MELTTPSSDIESVPIKCVQVCQGKSCRKLGASKVLAAFQSQPIADVEVMGCSCLGQCGNGPIVVVLPDQIWYCRVRSDEVEAIIARHLKNGLPIKAMLYPKFHPAPH